MATGKKQLAALCAGCGPVLSLRKCQMFLYCHIREKQLRNFFGCCASTLGIFPVGCCTSTGLVAYMDSGSPNYILSRCLHVSIVTPSTQSHSCYFCQRLWEVLQLVRSRVAAILVSTVRSILAALPPLVFPPGSFHGAPYQLLVLKLSMRLTHRDSVHFGSRCAPMLNGDKCWFNADLR